MPGELRGYGFGALDFGNNMSTAVFRLQQLAGLFDIFKGAYKGDGQVVGIKGGGSFDITLSLSVRAGAERPPPNLLTPFYWRGPPG